MRIFAHRGVSSKAPENTMAAFVKCLDEGVHWFETDVESLKDSTLVIMHDDSVDRTTNGSGRLADMTFDQVRRLDAGAWFSSAYRMERVPEVLTVIDFVNDTSMSVDLEMKPQTGSLEARKAYVETMAEMVSRVKDASKVIVSSFMVELLEEFGQLQPDIELAYIIDRAASRADLQGRIEAAQTVGAKALNIEFDGLTEAVVSAIHQAGLEVNVWTVNNVDDAKELSDWGVDGVFTDHPGELIAVGLQD